VLHGRLVGLGKLYVLYGEFVDAEVRPVKELCARNGGGPWRSAW